MARSARDSKKKSTGRPHRTKMTSTVTVRVRLKVEEPSLFPQAATAYAIRELARRAGVSAEMFRAWRIEFGNPGYVEVFVKPGTNCRVRFPKAGPRFWERFRAGKFHTSTLPWFSSPADSLALIPDFKIPFSSDAKQQTGPLFALRNEECAECAVDLPVSTLLTLSRYEETLPGPRDEHGRFSAYSSIAWNEGFLHRPIVDEYGLALEQALIYLLPGWRPQERRLRVKLGHDVDEIGVPFSLRSALGHTLRRKHPLATIRDLLASSTGVDTTYQVYLRRVVELSIDRGLHSAVYWKASDLGPYDSGYDPHHKQIALLIEAFRSRDVEMGIHPGYGSFDSPAQLRAEVAVLRQLLGEDRLGGRQDYLRWKPETWLLWDSLGLAYDASVGFADQIGFRAGTSYPYRPWLLSQSREADLLEIPLLAMDSTLQGYMKLQPDQALSKLRDCVARCRAVGGVFTLVWHNTKLMETSYTRIYRQLLDELAGTSGYDGRTMRNGSLWE